MAHSMFDLTGKVAVVTGGNGGIGLGMAEGLARAGAAVCIWGRSEEKNREAAKALAAHGGGVLTLPCDVADEGAVEDCMARTLADFGRVDAVFANAGMLDQGGRFHEITTESWRRVFSVNLDGAFFTFRAAVRHMMERGGGGSLVGTASISAIQGMPRGEHYAATKAGLVTMCRSIAVEYGKYGIRANAVVPGWIETEMTQDLFAWDRFRDKVLPRIPQRRWGRPSDFEAVAVYLAADESSYHTGDVLVVDGSYINF
ncbi:MAG: SDR family NAD(P)-dependent oxidoreductase [Desulfatibacillaceae bacterium]